MSYLSYPRSPATAKTTAGRRGRRAATCAALLLSSVTTLFSLGALHAPPAAAATGAPSGEAHAAAQPVSTARVTTAVLDLDASGREPTVYGEDVPYDTASIVKVDILAALLLQAQDAGRHLTAEERALAEPMIRHSDNAAANALWREIGRAPGLEAANKRLGLTATKGGPGAKWGLTQTTARDQIRLLRAVFDGTTPSAPTHALNEESRAYIRSLMSRVADDQAWGVSAAAGSQWALKNGWLQRSTTGLWDVNSVGRITANGHHYLVAVLSGGSASMSDGVALVEKAARQALSSVSPGKQP
ncbi:MULTISPECIES: serine hydrolase [unclassified Streptomyces]|uniref:serine hydrolase n=1 Tax=unclassified Streptomyces TaxID=2593676 RepID=UPI0027410E08|nr:MULTISPECIES: serine hydrolase [unclassified Streptomyces]